MPVSKQQDSPTSWRLSFDSPPELLDFSPGVGARAVEVLRLSESGTHEVPADGAGRGACLSELLAQFPNLLELEVETHLCPDELSHPTLRRLTASGAVALTPLKMPALTHLRLAISGDEHGVAMAFESFSWLLEGDGLPRLISLDARGLDVELHRSRRPSFVKRWAEAPVLRQLKELGIPGEEVQIAALKKDRGAFEHLDVLVVSRLRSATDRNPLGGNVLFESEFPDVPLHEITAVLRALPDLKGLLPSMKDAAFESLVAEIEAVPVRFAEGPLAATLGRFCKKGQWGRVERLLAMAKKKAPYRRAFMEVRERTEVHVSRYLDRHHDDVRGHRLREELQRQNRP